MNNEELFNEVARNVAQMLGPHMPFVLVAQPMEETGELAWVTNMESEDVRMMCNDIATGTPEQVSSEPIFHGTKQ